MREGRQATDPEVPRLAWHDVPVEQLFLDSRRTRAFTGVIYPLDGVAISEDGRSLPRLYGYAVENGAPLTALAFKRGLTPLGSWGNYLVLLSVLLFAVSTAISWNYYGDRCANYLFGPRAILPYKMIFVLMHFLGAVFALSTVWTLGDVSLGLVTFPNLIALILLAGVTARLTKSYFQRKPWQTQPQR